MTRFTHWGGVLVCTVAVSSLPQAARAEARPSSRNPLASMVPSSQEHTRAREAELARRLQANLLSLDGVAEARVHVDLPDASSTPLDQPLPEPFVSLIVRGPAARSSDPDLLALVRASALDLEHARVTLTRLPPAPRSLHEPLVSVGPFRVTAPSAPRLRAVLAASLIANVLLAAVLLARLRGSPP